MVAATLILDQTALALLIAFSLAQLATFAAWQRRSGQLARAHRRMH